MKYFSDNGIVKFYAYKEKPRDKRVVEFGWIPVRFIQSGRNFVVAKSPSHPEENNAATLDDYNSYFLKLTRMSPEAFLSRWDEKPDELEKFWYREMPHTEPGTHDFIYKLAYLIKDKKPFEHNFSKRLTHYEVVEVENAGSGNSSGNKD